MKTTERKILDSVLDNSDVNVAARILQMYRDMGKISYLQINSKIYYKTFDVDAFVQSKINKRTK